MGENERVIEAYPVFVDRLLMSGIEAALICFVALLVAFLVWRVGGGANIGRAEVILGVVGFAGLVYLMIRIGGAIGLLDG